MYVLLIQMSILQIKIDNFQKKSKSLKVITQEKVTYVPSHLLAKGGLLGFKRNPTENKP